MKHSRIKYQNVIAVVLLLGFTLLSPCVLARQPDSSLHVKKLMTSQQFNEAGLNKLTAKELTALDNWLNSFTDQVVTLSLKAKPRGQDESVAPPPSTAGVVGNVIESQIAGDFEGWEGETIFKLTNGQIWQQSEYDYTYEYAYRPSVTIYKTSQCWKMKVEDVEDTICVKRLK